MKKEKFHIKNVAIIGLGLIGGSIAKALKRSNFEINVAAFDNEETLNLAISEKVIDVKLNSTREALEFDFILLCLPTYLSLKIFKELLPLLKTDTIISDVCGVKGQFEKIWKKYKSKGIYIGGHPMSGKEVGGYMNSEPLLFENAVYIISEMAKENKRIEEFLFFIQLLGARGLYLDPFLHDKVIAHVSHLPQLLAIALLQTASNKKEDVNLLDFAAGGFKDLTRIASSNFDIWKSILDLNKSEIINSIEDFRDNLNQIKDMISNKDFDSLNLMFENAKINRDSISENKKGFITPLFDLFVFIQDEPGVLFNITKSLAEENINIKDIELQKIRENVGGTFRLSFASQNELETAKSILHTKGFTTDF